MPVSGADIPCRKPGPHRGWDPVGDDPARTATRPRRAAAWPLCGENGVGEKSGHAGGRERPDTPSRSDPDAGSPTCRPADAGPSDGPVSAGAARPPAEGRPSHARACAAAVPANSRPARGSRRIRPDREQATGPVCRGPTGRPTLGTPGSVQARRMDGEDPARPPLSGRIGSARVPAPVEATGPALCRIDRLPRAERGHRRRSACADGRPLRARGQGAAGRGCRRLRDRLRPRAGRKEVTVPRRDGALSAPPTCVERVKRLPRSRRSQRAPPMYGERAPSRATARPPMGPLAGARHRAGRHRTASALPKGPPGKRDGHAPSRCHRPSVAPCAALADGSRSSRRIHGRILRWPTARGAAGIRLAGSCRIPPGRKHGPRSLADRRRRPPPGSACGRRRRRNPVRRGRKPAPTAIGPAGRPGARSGCAAGGTNAPGGFPPRAARPSGRSRPASGPHGRWGCTGRLRWSRASFVRKCSTNQSWMRRDSSSR